MDGLITGGRTRTLLHVSSFLDILSVDGINSVMITDGVETSATLALRLHGLATVRYAGRIKAEIGKAPRNEMPFLEINLCIKIIKTIKII